MFVGQLKRQAGRLARGGYRAADAVVGRVRPPFPVQATFAETPGAWSRPVDLDHDLRTTPSTTTGRPHPLLGAPVRAPRPHQVIVAGVPRGHLLADGAVVARGKLVTESIWDPDHHRRSYSRAHLLPRARRVEGTVASLLSLWADNHYHWVLDVLPRLATLEAAGLAHLPLVVPAGLRPAQRESLDLLGVPAARQVVSHGHLVADELVWASSPSPIIHTTPVAARWLREHLSAGRAPGPPRRLYVRREVSRRVANEDAVLAELLPLGFEVLEAERLGFAGQVAAFADAEAVVAPHGAGLVGLVFGGGAKVLELFGEDYVNTGFRNLSAAAGHDYRYLIGAATGPPARQGADMTVPLEPLRRSLEEMFGTTQEAWADRTESSATRP